MIALDEHPSRARARVAARYAHMTRVALTVAAQDLKVDRRLVSRSWRDCYGSETPSRKKTLRPETTPSGDYFREIVLRHVGRLEPRQAMEIHRLVCDDYGRVSDRTVYRALRYLIETGQIAREPEGYLRARSR